jgi:hypothetical protein
MKGMRARQHAAQASASRTACRRGEWTFFTKKKKKKKKKMQT